MRKLFGIISVPANVNAEYRKKIADILRRINRSVRAIVDFARHLYYLELSQKLSQRF